jgi:hypothetical protein
MGGRSPAKIWSSLKKNKKNTISKILEFNGDNPM